MGRGLAGGVIGLILLWCGGGTLQAHESDGGTAQVLSVQGVAAVVAERRVTYCVDPDWAPYEIIDEAGRHRGIAADLLALVAQRAGVTLSLVPTTDWKESLAASQAGRCQLLSFLNSSPERRQWLEFTDPLFVDPNVIITQGDHSSISDLADEDGALVVLPRGTSIEEWLRRDYPKLVIILAENEAEAFSMVSSRRADMTIRSMTVAVDTIRKKGWFNLKVAGQVPGHDNLLRIGVRHESAAEMVPILNSAITTLTLEERTAIANRHVAIEVNTGLDPVMVRDGVVLAAVVLLTSMLWSLKVMAVNRRLRRLSVTDGLTGLRNRAYLNGRLRAEISRVQRQGGFLSVVLLDVDHFKLINDTGGHLVGDQVLVTLAACLQQHVRPEDCVGRWGGEEFLLICPGTRVDGAVGLAERLRALVADLRCSGGIACTISAGVAEVTGADATRSDVMDQLLGQADLALYRAKAAGRNRIEAA